LSCFYFYMVIVPRQYRLLSLLSKELLESIHFTDVDNEFQRG
jgi:hypothetical protein